jgi:TPP-dependent 2-oxoacid decarboxylase
MAGFHRFKLAAASALLCALTTLPCIAQETPESGSVTDEAQPEVSRQEWMERIQEAKQRAKDAALEHRMHPERYVPSPEDKARIASERVLNDNSLQPGDIVSTDKGLFVFRGSADQPPKSEDFVPLPSR